MSSSSKFLDVVAKHTGASPVQIYTTHTSDHSNYFFGSIAYWCEDFVAVVAFDDYGGPYDWTFLEPDGIHRIEIGTHLVRSSQLVDAKWTSHPPPEARSWIDLLGRLKVLDVLMTYWTTESSEEFEGKVHDVTEEAIVVRAIDDFARDDGLYVIRMEHLQRVMVKIKANPSYFAVEEAIGNTRADHS